MENLVLTRIDFRLIHGQVMTRWVKKLNVQHIIVIDDNTATSFILKKIILNAAPENIETEVLTVKEAAAKFSDGTLSDKRLLILFKDANTAAEAYKEGVKYDTLQIGGIEGSGEKKAVATNLVMSEEDMLALKPVHEAGVRIYAQPIPEVSEVDFSVIEKKF